MRFCLLLDIPFPVRYNVSHHTLQRGTVRVDDQVTFSVATLDKMLCGQSSSLYYFIPCLEFEFGPERFVPDALERN